MSASWPGNMRGPWLKTPLLLLLLLLTSLTGTVLCDEDEGAEPETGTEDEVSDPEAVDDAATEIPATDPSPTETEGSDPAEENTVDHSGDETYSDVPLVTTEYSNVTDWTAESEDEEGLNPIIILIPVVLVVVIIGMIVCGIFINRRWNKKARNQELSKEDPYLDGSSTEKVPMPMFEEDVPSVLELEMEELDQWMKKDGGAAEDSKHT
ncbi:transmembrane protein 154 [Stegastes partitus]|uniref:Transmembrane protein 154 n=1 Tax=Stegastes partitus TaxID=144197 RepID=A0A3B5A1K0_9TELE|nr:PREDICTED: transmembrane protein 154 [Stegastes partitus]XP_008304438.1 PREDICTED: transmembrane protein 154 [Stegastes partitus]